MKIGVFIVLSNEVEAEFKKAHDMGFSYCQLACWEEELMNDENAAIVNECCEKYGIKISSFWCGWKGPAVWDLVEGPITLGLVPVTYRFERMKELMHGSDFCKKINVENIITHVGFIPVDPNCHDYRTLVSALREVATYVKNNGQYFLFETGQETPVTLLRTIEDVGTGNLGINLDPANLIDYGMGNPIDALGVFGKYVRDVHAKDSTYPTDGRHCGQEKPLGEGKVNFPKFIEKLKEIGYDGTLTIEREISGEQQIIDIKNGKEYLEKLI